MRLQGCAPGRMPPQPDLAVPLSVITLNSEALYCN